MIFFHSPGIGISSYRMEILCALLEQLPSERRLTANNTGKLMMIPAATRCQLWNIMSNNLQKTKKKDSGLIEKVKVKETKQHHRHTQKLS